MDRKDKLYSRNRIKLPSFSRLREISGFKIFLLIMLMSIIIICAVFLKTAYPVFKTSCETAASSKGTKIVNDEVNEVMKNYTYDSLIKIEKDVDGKISYIEADSRKINEIVSEIISNIQEEFDKIPRTTVYINMGTVSGISILQNYNPKFNIELESSGTINAQIRTEFKEIGINQTQHKIYLDVDTRIGILTPFSSFGKDINADVLLTEAIIVGDVPDSYYNLDGITDIEDTYNFLD